MLEKIKYNFWLLLFIGILVVFLYFLYLATSFSSVHAYRWLIFLTTPLFTSGIHLLIRSRSANAEWLSITNFLFIALLVAFFNTYPEYIKTYWTWLGIPVFNQLSINSFDVIWKNKYPFKWPSFIAICVLWLYSVTSIMWSFPFPDWIILSLGSITIILCFISIVWGEWLTHRAQKSLSVSPETDQSGREVI